MEVGKRMEMLERRLSIETEPMTLYLEQIQHAREEAMCVLKTKTTQEAMDIFTKETREGLRAEGLRADKKRGKCMNLKDNDDDDDDDDEEDERMMYMSPHGWDIATAPF